jgi:hypothetical protein
MNIKLQCAYYNEQGEKIGEYGDVLELPPAEAEALVRGGSAEVVVNTPEPADED